MNRPRLQILADHLRSLPDERFDMANWFSKEGENDTLRALASPGAFVHECGTAACVAGWAVALFSPRGANWCDDTARDELDLSARQAAALFEPHNFEDGRYTRTDAIAAIQSMLDSPDDDALPVWPSREGDAA